MQSTKNSKRVCNASKQQTPPRAEEHIPSLPGTLSKTPSQQFSQQSSQTPNHTHRSAHGKTSADSSASFEDMLAETRAEQPCFFQPKFADEEVNFFESSKTRQIPTGQPTFLTALEESAKKLAKQPRGNHPGTYHAGIFQFFGTDGFVSGRSSAAPFSQQIEQPSRKAPKGKFEDPSAYGALSIPVIDQYPCFQGSCDGNNLKFVGAALTSFCDPSAFLSGAAVKAGSFLEVEDLSSITKKDFPSPTELDFQAPLSDTTVLKSLSGGDIAISRQPYVAVQVTDSNAVNAFNVSTTTTPVPASPRASIQMASSAPKPPTSTPSETQPTARSVSRAIELPPGSINIQPRGVTSPVQELSFPSNSKELHNLGRPPPTPITGNHIVRRHRNHAFMPAEASQQISPASSQVTPGNQILLPQFTAYRQNTPVRQGSPAIVSLNNAELQHVLQRKASHASSNYLRNPSSGKFRANRLPVNPTPAEGPPVITPTSIIPDMPFDFKANPQQSANTPVQRIFPDLPFDAQQISANEILGWEARKRNEKRGICQVGSAQMPTKKSRTVASHLAPQLTKTTQGGREEDASQISRARRTQNMHYKSPATSVCSDRTATQVPTFTQVPPQTPAVRTGETETFLSHGVAQPMQAQAGPSNFGGPLSAATIVSPSKTRSIYVREEKGEMPKRFVCSDCQASFAFKENCERHFKVAHQGRTVYFCHHCPASYLQSKTLRCHIDKKHHVIDGKNSIFPCYWCDFKTSTSVCWSAHVSERHPGHKNTFRGTAT